MSILKNFVKYQSLGNDFIIFDWYKKPSTFMQIELQGTAWQQFVQRMCDRHYGVGADGVLILAGFPQAGMPEMLIFNADGTQAENCLNGLRCVAHYLFTTYNFPQRFSIKVGARIADCIVQQDPHHQTCEIITRVGMVNHEQEQEIVINGQSLKGNVASIGNPHFIIFDKRTEEWVRTHGPSIESHEIFPYKTNIEFVWPSREGNSSSFEVIVFERGCGITLACSSGAACITSLLVQKNIIAREQKVVLKMQGGAVTAWLDADGSVVLQATAQSIFSGTFHDQIIVSKILTKDAVLER
ncbi:MAG: diaminopimelate epimerase [Candidatus Babeliales bacterium]|jgi:diaminopimelate epimerase